MKLASLKNGGRDGTLVLVSRDLTRAAMAGAAETMIDALENWDSIEPALAARYQALNDRALPDAFPFEPSRCHAPLPRAPQWCDGSAFLNHGHLMQKAFHMEPPEDQESVPLMYQGASDIFYGPHDEIRLPSEEHGIDFEGEFAVMLDEVPLGCSAAEAAGHVKLILMVNDVSLRAFAAYEMRRGFGWIQAKPSSGFAAVAVTPDELGSTWRDGRVHLPLTVTWNGRWFGNPSGAEMNFSFFELVAHAARTRRLSAGTIIGSGTVSNRDSAAGSACIAERRAIEMIEQGAAKTGFMRFGDRVGMEVRDPEGNSLFGAIDQKIVPSHG